MITHVVLIRHATVNADSRLCGWFDVPLSPAGQREVQALVSARPSRPRPAALYTSTLTRARQVADTLARAWGLQPWPVDWAREIHCGDLEGMPLVELQRSYPELWTQNVAQNNEGFAWPGGESYSQFRSRVLAGVRALAAAHPGGRVALVTHAGVISQVLGVMRGRPAAAWALDRPDPFTATEIAWGNGTPSRVLSYNDRNWY